jgi:hypothetical protein
MAMNTKAGRCCTQNIVNNISDFIWQHAAVGIAESGNIGTCLHGNSDYLKSIGTICTVSIEEVLCIKKYSLAFLAQVAN